MTELKHVEMFTKSDRAKLMKNWKHKEYLLKNILEHRHEYLKVLNELQIVWDGHLRRTAMEQNFIRLTSFNERPIQSTFYREGPKAKQIAADEIKNEKS